MAVLALGAAGAAIGSAIGGTFLGVSAAAWGWSIGAFAGQALFPTKLPDQNLQGPRISDLKIQTSSYGQMIPLVYGICKIAGNIIWASEVREVATTTSQTQGGKGGGGGQTVTQTTYSYFADVAIAIGEGEISSIRRIWVNGELKYDVSATAAASSVAASAVGARSMIFYSGSESQAVDPTIEAAEGADTPAYRGTAYVVFENLDVTTYGARIPQMEFEIVANGTVASTLSISAGTTVGTSATLSSSVTPVIGSNGNVWYIGSVSNTAVLVNYYTGATVATYTRALWGYNPIGPDYYGNSAVFNNYGGYLGFLGPDGTVTEYSGAPGIFGSGGSLFGIAWLSSLGGYAQGDSSSSDNLYFFSLNESTLVVNEQLLSDARSTHLFTNACGIAGRCFVYGSFSFNHEVGYISSSNSKVLLFSGNQYAAYGLLVSRAGYLWMARNGASTVVEKRDQDGTLLGSVTLPGSVAASKLLEAPDGMIMAYSASNACYLIHPTTLDISYTSANPGTKAPLGFLEDGRLILSSTSGANFLLHEMERLPRVTASSVTLASVVTDLCSWAGLSASEIDVSELTDTVGGYAVARRDSVRSAIEPLRMAYKFDAVESAGQVAFRKRGRAVSVVIDEDDLAARRYGEEPPAKVAAERSMETELPDEIAVQHIDPSLSYEINSQYARRLTGQSSEVRNVDVPLVLTAAQAAGVAEYLLYDAWVSRNTQTVRVSRKHATIEPTDVVQFESDGVTYTSRVVEVNDADGVLTLTLVDDDADIVDTTATGVSGPAASDTVSAIGPTIARLLDIPLLRDVDDGAGFYAAVTGLYGGWRGAEL
ncbi:MAG: phage tail protein, partial [Thermomicrobiales bacterium]|nr:phage tail protein [Thermomicrobiales bacterium]